MSRVFPQIGLILFLLAVLILSTDLLHKILQYVSPSLADAVARLEVVHEPRPMTSPEQDTAVALARRGNYDEAIARLGALYEKDKVTDHPSASLGRDYAAVLAWAGHDQEAVTVYETLKQPVPNYVSSAVAHSYRVLGQSDKALATYKAGLEHQPTNVAFAEGAIRSLLDMGELDSALSLADQDEAVHGDRPEISAIRQDIMIAMARRDRDNAVRLARENHFPEAIAQLSTLHTRYPENPDVTRDYLTVLDWAGNHDADVETLYKALPADGNPDYVLAAAAHAYRNTKQYDEALPIYQMGQNKFPSNVTFAVGVVRILSDMKRYDEAVAAADADMKANGERSEVLKARKDAIAQMPHQMLMKRTKKHA